MDAAEDLVWRLACNDEKAFSMVLSCRRGTGETELLSKVELLVELVAFLVGAAILVLRESTAQASARLAAAIGVDLERGSG